MFSTNHAHILISEDVTEAEVAKIRTIFVQSNCPNESLHASLGDIYKGIDNDGNYVFGNGLNFTAMVVEY